jgi:ferredoxin
VKGFRIREEMNGIEASRKTWFWELEAGVIFADRCIQCGTCVAVCPSNSLGVAETAGLPELVKMCTGCSLVLGLLSPGRAPLRGVVAAVDARRRGRPRPRWW